MTLHAHIGADGTLVGLVAAPEGAPSLRLSPEPGVQVAEVQGYDIKGDAIELNQLVALLETHAVVLTPAHATLINRNER